MTCNTHPHLKALAAKHQKIDDDIVAEENRPQPDTLKLSQLKKDKLHIKDAMAAFEKENSVLTE